jgi:uncharacterized protein (DUF1499 family)
MRKVNVRTLPLHTKREVAVGLAFDVLNGKRSTTIIDKDGQVVNDERQVINPDTMSRVFKNAKDVRWYMERDFDFMQTHNTYIIVVPVGGGVGFATTFVPKS